MRVEEPARTVAPAASLLAAGRPAAGAAPAAGRRRLHPTTLVAIAIAGLLVANTVLTTDDRPQPDQYWRWLTIAAAAALCAWNAYGAARAYRAAGLLSVAGFFHLWCFVAFSFPAAEMTYRYPQLTVGFWHTATDRWQSLVGVLLLAAFEVIFIVTLGGDAERAAVQAARARPGSRPNLSVALLLLLALLPFLRAKLIVLRDLGLHGALVTMITRRGYWEQLHAPESRLTWVLNVLFPVYAVSLASLVVKFAVRHPSPAGRRLYAAVLILSGAGVVSSGGRAELAYVLVTVLGFMYLQGYRLARDYRAVAVPVVLVALAVVLVAQARHGGQNLLWESSGRAYVGYDYQRGDLTQILGVGRFEAILMILDHRDTQPPLWGKSYAYAAAGGLNTVFASRVAIGGYLPTWRVSDRVMGNWIFGSQVASALPSTPGELLLNFGVPGVLVGAALLGVLCRFWFRWLLGRRWPIELLFVLSLWTLARVLSDESYLMAGFIAANLPLAVVVSVLLARARAVRGRP